MRRLKQNPFYSSDVFNVIAYILLYSYIKLIFIISTNGPNVPFGRVYSFWPITEAHFQEFFSDWTSDWPQSTYAAQQLTSSKSLYDSYP